MKVIKSTKGQQSINKNKKVDQKETKKKSVDSLFQKC
jgi:hypothetical protein